MKQTITVFELVMLWIVVVSLTAVLLLVSHQFSANVALLGGTLLVGVVMVLCSWKVAFPAWKCDRTLLVIMLLAVFFRATPSLFVLGGRDEGVYVSMSAAYERNGSTFITDPVRTVLSKDERALYDFKNISMAADAKNVGGYVANKMEGHVVPGIYIQRRADSRYYFQFYPLHPLWMAMAARVCGAEARVYSVVWFSLLTILIFFHFAVELSDGNRTAGYVMALLLAVNPAHAFFSKFPTSESVSLFFSSAGFYYLLKYYKRAIQGTLVPAYLILSAGLLACLFFNHVAGMYYLPLFIVLLLLLLLHTPLQPIQKHLCRYCMVVIGSLGGATLYGYYYTYSYVRDIYNMAGRPLVGAVTALFPFPAGITIAILVGLVILALAGLYIFRVTLTPLIMRLLYPLLPGILLAQILFRGIRHVIEGPQNQAFLMYDSTFLVFIHLLSPLIFLASLLALKSYLTRRDPAILALIGFLCITFFLRVIQGHGRLIYLQQANSGPLFWSARYFLSDTVPYFFLLTVPYLVAPQRFRRFLTTITLILSIGYMSYQTSFQLQGAEADGEATALARLQRHLDPHDVLFTLPISVQLKTALTYYYGLNTVSCLFYGQFANFPSLHKHFQDKFVLSVDMPLTYPNLQFVEAVTFRERRYNERLVAFPTRLLSGPPQQLYLYRYLRRDLNDYIIGRAGFMDEVWTQGDATLTIDHYPLAPQNQYLAIQTGGHRPKWEPVPPVRLQAWVNGMPLQLAATGRNCWYFQLSPGKETITEIVLRSTTFTIQQIAPGSSDTRIRGIDLVAVQIYDTLPSDAVAVPPE